MRWMLAILLMVSPFANAAGDAASFQKLTHQAEDARQANHLPEAIQLYRRAIRLRPSWSEGWWWLGGIYYDQDLYPEAREAFEHSLTGNRPTTPAYAFLGLCDYEMRDYTAARAHLGKWIAGGAPGETQLADVARFHWAELLTQDGHFLEALLQLHREVSIHGPTPALVEAMGLAWMQIRSVPEDYAPEKREMVWLAGSAAASFSAGKQDRAMEFLDKLDARYGDQPNVHFLRGFIFESTKDTDAAIREYSHEAAITPQLAAPMIQLSLLYSDTGEQKKALRFARQAVVLESGNARAHYALGRALEANQNWAESAAELEKARDLSPNTARFHFQLAKAYRKLGRKQEAEREDKTFEFLDKNDRAQSAAADPASLREGLEAGRR